MFFDWITPVMSMLMRDKVTFVIDVAHVPVLNHVQGLLHNENIMGDEFIFDVRNKNKRRICRILDNAGIEYWYN